MNQQDAIVLSLEDLGATLRMQPSLKENILRQLSETSQAQPVFPRVWYQGQPLRGILSLAVCLLVVFGIWQFAGSDSASKVFADSLAAVRQARTFTCINTWETIEDGKTFVNKERIMFKEPHLERREVLESRFPEAKGSVTIHDYKTRRRIDLSPTQKVAYLSDYQNDYVVDEATGKLKLRELDTRLRDKILAWATEEVDDRGFVEFQGKTVRLLTSRRDPWDLKIWIDPKSKAPLQVQLKTEHTTSTYSSIAMDESLDDNLFSFAAPKGYQLQKANRGWAKRQSQINAKLSFLVIQCHVYFSDHDQQFPQQLSNLTSNDDINEQILKNILADPNNLEGKPIIRYHQPAASADWSKTVIMYQAFEQWPKDGVVTCFADGRREIILDQDRFNQLLPTASP